MRLWHRCRELCLFVLDFTPPVNLISGIVMIAIAVLTSALTTIYGSSTTLLEDSQAMTDAQKAQILVGIKEDAQWLIRMVENLLSITRIDSGSVRIVKTPTILDELVDSVILKFNKRYPSQKVTLELPEDVVIIPMDAILMEQVMVNILENAAR